MMKNTMMIILLSSTLAFPFTASAFGQGKMGGSCIDKTTHQRCQLGLENSNCDCIKDSIEDKIKEKRSGTAN